MGHARWSAVRVAAAYVVIATAWIVGSDALIGVFPSQLEESLQTIKGLLFVGITGLVLYVLVQRMYDDITRGSRQARSAEVLLRQVIDTVPVGVLFVNDEGVITFMNPAAEGLLSITVAEGVGRRLEELSSDATPETAASVGELLRTGAVDGMRLGRPDEAAPRAFVARAKAVDPEASMTGWVIALADITEAHRAGQRMERLMGSYRFLADALVLCGRATDPHALVAHVAAIAVQRGGYAGAWAMLKPGPEAPFEDVALIGLGERAADVAQLLRAEALTSRGAITDALLDSRVSVGNDIARDPAHPWHAVAEESGVGASASFGVVGPGDMRASITLFAPVPGYFDAEEIDVLRQLQGALAFAFEKIGLDRERFAAEEALEKSERGYRQLFDCHPMPLWVYDLDSLCFLAVNDAAQRKYGWSREEFARMTIADIRPPSEVPAVLDTVANASEGFTDLGVWTHTDSDGRSFPVHVYSHAIDWDGRAAKLVMSQEIARMC